MNRGIRGNTRKEEGEWIHSVHISDNVLQASLKSETWRQKDKKRPKTCRRMDLHLPSFTKNEGRIAAFGPSGGKKMHVLQSVFHQIPRNPMMLWN
jgi:hypothetical protein